MYRLKSVLFFFVSCHVLIVFTNNETTTEESTTKGIKDQSWKFWCKMQPVTGDCNNGVQLGRFYYDIKLEDCESFAYGKCSNSFNEFTTISECHAVCNDVGLHVIKERNLSEQVMCRLQPDFGRCQQYHPMFYYDVNSQHCKGFSYSGCGGNENRFDSHQLCSSVCGRELGMQVVF